MPELPEVETVRTVLAPYLVGQTVTAVEINLPKVTANMSPAEFSTKLTGQTIDAVTRRGKYLTLCLKNGAKVIVHLRMTGCLTVNDPDEPRLKHTNLVLTLGSGQELRFEDSRGFGKWWYLAPGTPDTSGQQNLGPEPNAVTGEYLQSILTTRRTAIKTLLLDQHLVAGIGNIYSDEICFQTGILPTRPGCSLTSAEITKLVKVIPAVINQFIVNHRVPFDVYAQSQGKSYQTDRYLQVYGRAGLPCPVCHTTLVGTRINGRSSVYCPKCQK